MKKYILTLVLFSFIGITSYAQNNAAPRTEFTAALSETALTVKPGESKNSTLTLNRSKSFSKSDATLGLSSGLPEGVHVTFSPAEGAISSSEVKVAVDETAKAGNYTIIIRSTIQNKNKGTTLKLTVLEKDGSVVSLN